MTYSFISFQKTLIVGTDQPANLYLEPKYLLPKAGYVNAKLLREFVLPNQSNIQALLLLSPGVHIPK